MFRRNIQQTFCCLFNIASANITIQPAIECDTAIQPAAIRRYVRLHTLFNLCVCQPKPTTIFVPIFGIERCLQKLKEISFRISHCVHVAMTMCWALRSTSNEKKTWIPWLDSKTEVLMWFFQSWFRYKILLVLMVIPCRILVQKYSIANVDRNWFSLLSRGSVSIGFRLIRGFTSVFIFIGKVSVRVVQRDRWLKSTVALRRPWSV